MEILPQDLLDDLREATLRNARRRTRLHIRTGEEVWPVLRRWKDGFALEAGRIATLRGFVDLYDGSRHVSTCLIVASEIADGELICTVKSEQRVTDRPALDYARGESAPVALLPRF